MYPERELFREITFIAYYLHWPEQALLDLTHEDRRQYCAEISEVHEQMGGPRPANPFLPLDILHGK